MKKKLLYYLLFLISNIFSICNICIASEKEFVSVNVFNEIYYGTLDQITEGENTLTVFTTVPSSDTQFSITGKWKNGAFTKDCTISYEDGTVQSVTYKDAHINGEIITTNPNGTYHIFSCNKSKPYKKIKSFSDDGDLIDLDWFYACTPMKTWYYSAVSPDYDLLFSNPYDYINLPFRVSGTVDAVYENDKQAILFVKDKNDDIYLFRYQNLKVDTYGQANVPNLSVGDEISITGIFLQIRDFQKEPITLYNNSLCYETDFADLETLEITDANLLQFMKEHYQISNELLVNNVPEFNAVFCTKKNSTVNPLFLSKSYNEICAYPFYYIDETISLTGTVLKEYPNTESNLVELLVQEQNTSNIYAVSYKTKEYNTLQNQHISFDGTLNGNYKLFCYNSQTASIGYVLYPDISVSEIDVLK